MGDFNRIERKKVPAIQFGTPSITSDPSLIRPVPEAPIYNVTYKVNPMFALKSKAIKWALTALATIPEEYLWDFVKTV
ncbi:hypothetical protein RZS08_47655, partial [Arthrospira platensis SPKY1]|nr:hypothetical protein [Arthrospira platensis SPKY1]